MRSVSVYVYDRPHVSSGVRVFGVSGCLGVWVSGCLGVWVSGCLGVVWFRCLGVFRVFRLGVQDSGIMTFWKVKRETREEAQKWPKFNMV